MKPVTITVQHACKYSGLCHSTIYNLINAKKIESCTVGRRRLIIVSSLDRLLGLEDRRAA